MTSNLYPLYTSLCSDEYDTDDSGWSHDSSIDSEPLEEEDSDSSSEDEDRYGAILVDPMDAPPPIDSPGDNIGGDSIGSTSPGQTPGEGGGGAASNNVEEDKEAIRMAAYPNLHRLYAHALPNLMGIKPSLHAVFRDSSDLSTVKEHCLCVPFDGSLSEEAWRSLVSCYTNGDQLVLSVATSTGEHALLRSYAPPSLFQSRCHAL